MSDYTYASIKTPEGMELEPLYKIVLMPADRVWIAASTDDYIRLVNAGANPSFVRDACARGQDLDGQCFLSLHQDECVLHTNTDTNEIIRDKIFQMLAEEMVKNGQVFI